MWRSLAIGIGEGKLACGLCCQGIRSSAELDRAGDEMRRMWLTLKAQCVTTRRDEGEVLNDGAIR